MKSIYSEKVPAATGPHNQVIEASGFVFIFGQLPIDSSTGKFPEGGIREQTRQSILNAQEMLKAAGLDLSKIIKTTMYLSDMANFNAMNEVYTQFSTEPCPARSAIAVYTLPKEALVEVKCIAVKR